LYTCRGVGLIELGGINGWSVAGVALSIMMMLGGGSRVEVEFEVEFEVE
jgi:hypothetical protein